MRKELCRTAASRARYHAFRRMEAAS
jgi:hypothetical protein